MSKEINIIVEMNAYLRRTKQTPTMVAIKWQVSRQFISRILHGKAAPTEIMLEALGLTKEKKTIYTRKAKV